jgi:hypothetical protein
VREQPQLMFLFILFLINKSISLEAQKGAIRVDIKCTRETSIREKLMLSISNENHYNRITCLVQLVGTDD